MKNSWQNIPSINEVLNHPKVQAINLLESQKKEIINQVFERIRFQIFNDKNILITRDNIFELIIDNLNNHKNKLTRLINATGTIIHTNLGRSVLPTQVISNIVNIGLGYSNLEYDLETGKRGFRDNVILDLMNELTGAQDCIVVNNNAAGVFLTLNTLFKKQKVVISRGEEVEIGGSFRIPGIMKAAGVKLVEIGTTNRTHLNDYKDAINKEHIKGILKVHQSNFKISGFTQNVDIKSLAALKKDNIILVEDQGSGTLIDLSKYQSDLSGENTVKQSIENGADLVLFSGDKLLGGLQAGIIVGKKVLIDKMKKNQLMRTLRVNKLVLASLESILQIYKNESEAVKVIPTLKMICESEKDVLQRLNNVFSKVQNSCLELLITDTQATIGGGSYPQAFFASKAIAIKCRSCSSKKIYEYFKNYRTPIITIIRRDEVLIDFKTILEQDYKILEEAINEFKC